MIGSTTEQLIENTGLHNLATLMNLGSVAEVPAEIDRRLKRDGFIQDANGIWCELALNGESIRIGALK
jgi:hypothetical protein